MRDARERRRGDFWDFGFRDAGILGRVVRTEEKRSGEEIVREVDGGLQLCFGREFWISCCIVSRREE